LTNGGANPPSTPFAQALRGRERHLVEPRVLRIGAVRWTTGVRYQRVTAEPEDFPLITEPFWLVSRIPF
jgi:hypothetical protein